MTASILGEFQRTPVTDWLPIVHRKYEKVRSLFREPTTDELRQRQLKRVQQAMFRAAASYTLRTYPGRILNIVASQRIAEHDTRYSWSELAGGGSLTIEIAVRRTADLLASPYVENVSSHIQRFIADEFQDSSVRPANRAA